MDTGLAAQRHRSTAGRKDESVTQRPLPKTVTPLPDELGSGWLTRLVVANYCKANDLVAHIELETRQVATQDFEVATAAAEKISMAARVAPEIVRTLTFAEMTQTEALLTAQVPFQACPDCSQSGLALKHWRQAYIA